MKLLRSLIIVSFIPFSLFHPLCCMEQRTFELHTNSNLGLFARLYKAVFSAYSLEELYSFGLKAVRAQKYKDAAYYFEKIRLQSPPDHSLMVEINKITDILEKLESYTNWSARVQWDWEDNHPLREAVRHNHAKVVEVLLHLATCDDLAIDRNFLENYESQWQSDKEKALVDAVTRGFEKIVSLLLVSGVNPDTRSGIYPVLLLAVNNGHLGTVKLLVDHGANVNIVDEPLKRTALFGASTPEMVRLLLTGGAELGAVDCDGCTSLMRAIEKEDLNKMTILIDAGDHVNSRKPGEVWGPLHYAALLGKIKAIKLLIERGAKVNEAGVKGKTPLHYALAFGCKSEVVHYLLDIGAECAIQDGDGMLPHDYLEKYDVYDPCISCIRKRLFVKQ